MKTSPKQIALMMGLIAIASVGSAYAMLQENQPTTKGIQSEGIMPLGHIQLTLYSPDGSIKAFRQTDNLVVNNGANVTANTIFGTTLTSTASLSGTFKNIAVGIGTNAVASGNTALQTQQGHKIVGSASNGAQRGTASITATFAAGKITNSTTQAITEAGLFDGGTNLSSNSTNMFARQTFSAINVGSADSLQITWTINIT